MIWHALSHFFGMDNLSGAQYGFWSGVGSDIGEVGIIGGVATLVRHRNCEVHGCLRLGRHTTAAGHHVCRRHNPDGSPSAADVTAAHHDAKRRLGHKSEAPTRSRNW